MSILSRIRAWFKRKRPTPQFTSPSIAMVAAPLAPLPWTVRALQDALGFLRVSTRRPAETPRWAVKSLKLPEPMPGVVPKGERTMAMDAAIGSVYNFGGGYNWDGFGFMGYALLSELAQLPEYRKPSEILAKEMTRKWGKVVSKSEDDKTEKIKDIEDELKRIGSQAVFRRAFELDNFFGHGQIFIDLGKTEGDELKMPLAVDAKVGKGSLKGIRCVEPIWIYPNQYDSVNPLRPDYYRPQTWFVMGQEVHASRFLDFCSRPVPDMLKPAYLFGGVSLTQLLRPYVDNWLRTRQSVSDITHNYSTPVMKVDMSTMMQPGGAQLLAARADVFNTGRDNQGLMILDMAKEDFVNVSAPIAGLDKLQAQAQEQQASVASVPLVKLFGITPSGLNASSDGEVRVFYDTIESDQERTGTPNMERLLPIVQMSLFGVVDPDLGWKWEPLWSLDEEKAATVRKVDAETDQIYVDAGILAPQEVRATVAAAEDSRFNSIDVDDLPDLREEETEGLEPKSSAEKLAAAGEERDKALDAMFDAARAA